MLLLASASMNSVTFPQPAKAAMVVMVESRILFQFVAQAMRGKAMNLLMAPTG